jgi:hypothetical protein
MEIFDRGISWQCIDAGTLVVPASEDRAPGRRVVLHCVDVEDRCADVREALVCAEARSPAGPVGRQRLYADADAGGLVSDLEL